ncbi:MAG: hypothetical protein LBM93_02560 [Oscillospiraceae bacterium]|jgi:hypothetical protein|nr:hypothetical protein [Oscillospiraceae bacterium]
MKNLSKLIIFAVGVAVGATSAWYFAKRKYEAITQEEIDSVKEVFQRNRKNPKENEFDKLVKSYGDILTTCNYVSKKSDIFSVKDEHKKIEELLLPEMISDDVFGDNDDFETMTLFWYADKILADYDNEVIDNIDDVVGKETLKYLDACRGDVIYVRNPKLKCDYEICKDKRKFSNLIKEDIYE